MQGDVYWLEVCKSRGRLVPEIRQTGFARQTGLPSVSSARSTIVYIALGEEAEDKGAVLTNGQGHVDGVTAE
jgi:hypothetical protein